MVCLNQINQLYKIIFIGSQIFNHPMPLQSEAFSSKSRNFICSCGKAYLSYAALFTHIKQKHGGKAPGQIIRPRSQNKRGRPRKDNKLCGQKGLRNESYNGFLDNNNLKNINFANESNFNQNQSPSQNNLSKGFRSYKDDQQFLHHKSNLKKPNRSIQSPQRNTNRMRQQPRLDIESDMEFVDPNNQLSSNTLALASIIIGLQQLFKEVSFLQQVRDDRLEAFSSYADIRQFHSKKLLEKVNQKEEKDVFLLGNIICAFLNFCHHTVQSKAGYQQIVLLIVCLLEHIKNKNGGNILCECRKEAIHDSLPSFFQQYLEKVIIKCKLNYWIFQQNNSFKVLIWFLNWLSVIEVNYKKINAIQDVDEKQEQPQLFQFDCPNFMKQKIKKETRKMRQKNEIQGRDFGKNEEGEEFQEGEEFKEGESESKDESSEEQEVEVHNEIDAEEDNDNDSQFQPNESQKKHLIEMQRLSSEVR